MHPRTPPPRRVGGGCAGRPAPLPPPVLYCNELKLARHSLSEQRLFVSDHKMVAEVAALSLPTKAALAVIALSITWIVLRFIAGVVATVLGVLRRLTGGPAAPKPLRKAPALPSESFRCVPRLALCSLGLEGGWRQPTSLPTGAAWARPQRHRTRASRACR